MAESDKLIEVEGDKPKVERTRKHFREDPAVKALEQKFGSVLSLSVRVLRPMEKYPYEHEVWSSEIRVKVGERVEDIDSIVAAWVKTMEGGIELAKAIRDAGEIHDKEQ
jgi:hypothetical protein